MVHSSNEMEVRGETTCAEFPLSLNCKICCRKLFLNSFLWQFFLCLHAPFRKLSTLWMGHSRRWRRLAGRISATQMCKKSALVLNYFRRLDFRDKNILCTFGGNFRVHIKRWLWCAQESLTWVKLIPSQAKRNCRKSCGRFVRGFVPKSQFGPSYFPPPLPITTITPPL